MKICGLLLIMSLAAGLAAQENNLLKKDVLLYEPCESLKSENAGVKIANSIQVESQGKYGKAYRIERRTMNAMVNGDFAKKESNAWAYRDNADWQPSGGIGGSSCLKINGGDVSAPLTGLKTGTANAFSFHAKNAGQSGDALVSVSWESGGKQSIMVKDRKLGNDFERIMLPLTAESDSGTVVISVQGTILIDNAQLDKGVGFFNSYSPPGKLRSCDIIDIPVNGKYFSPEKGSFSCWINVPWLNPEVVGETVCTFFGVTNAETKIKKWGATSIIGICGIPKPKPSDKLAGTVNAYTVDVENRVVGARENMANLKLGDGPWHLWIVNWELKDGKMQFAMYLDGDKLKINKEQPFGPNKVPVVITVGYCGGGYLNGLMDDFAIFNRPLTEAEIMAIYKSPQPLSAALK